MASQREMLNNQELIKQNIPSLKFPLRRFDYKGTWEGRQIVDDYAHHPKEVEATLRTARLMIESRQSPFPKTPERILLVFQPHRYSRTKQFINEFANVLGKADELLLAPIYGAGETPIQGINSMTLAKAINQLYPNLPVSVANNLDEVAKLIQSRSLKDDIVLTMGAGDINSIWSQLAPPQNNDQWLPNIAA